MTGRRVALVTGASRRGGIGWAVAQRLAQSGCDVALQAYRAYDAEQGRGAEETPEDLAAELRTLGVEASAIEVDLGRAEAAAEVIDHVHDVHERLDVLVVNHTHWSGAPIHEISADEIDRALSVNVRASMLLIGAFVRRHDGAPHGRIVLMSSGQHLGPMPGESCYVASKGALHALTTSLAGELAGRGISVNAVDPGPTDTGWVSDAFRPELLARAPRGRIGEPDDAARLIAWLCSEDADWVTGELVASRGGFGSAR